jgi:hypothetical protein
MTHKHDSNPLSMSLGMPPGIYSPPSLTVRGTESPEDRLPLDPPDMFESNDILIGLSLIFNCQSYFKFSAYCSHQRHGLASGLLCHLLAKCIQICV